jgi:hypothetical protein
MSAMASTRAPGPHARLPFPVTVVPADLVR